VVDGGWRLVGGWGFVGGWSRNVVVVEGGRILVIMMRNFGRSFVLTK